MRVWWISLLASVLAGCATVQSRPESTTPTLAKDAAGVTYFLPRKLVKLTVSRAPVDIAKLKKARDGASSDLEAANKLKGEKKDAAEHEAAILDQLASDAAGRQDQVKRLELARAEQAQAEADAADATKAFEKAASAYLAALGGDASGGCTYEAKLDLQPASADRDHRYVGVLRHNWLRDDTFKLAVNPAGLLASANIVAADRTGDILVEAAGAYSALARGGGATVAAEVVPDQLDCGDPKSIVLLFDPTNSDELDEIALRLKTANYPFQVGPRWDSQNHRTNDIPTGAEVETARSTRKAAAALVISADKTNAEAIYKAYKGALFYRSPVPTLVTLERNVNNTWHVVDSAMVVLPQAGPISYIPANSSAFVKTVDDVVFVDGMVASWSPDRPSEVLEIVRLPVKVATAIISVPAQLVSLRVDYSSKAKSLADSQASEIAAQKSLAKLRACLAEAKVAGEDGTACLPTKE